MRNDTQIEQKSAETEPEKNIKMVRYNAFKLQNTSWPEPPHLFLVHGFFPQAHDN